MVSPEEWGPHIWKSIHYITMGYPKNPSNKIKNIYRDFLISFKYVLPCSMCANHYKEHLEKYPLTDDVMSSKENLMKWGIDIHNEVNKMKGKGILSYDNAIKNITNNDNNNTMLIILFIIILIIGLKITKTI